MRKRRLTKEKKKKRKKKRMLKREEKKLRVIYVKMTKLRRKVFQKPQLASYVAVHIYLEQRSKRERRAL